MIKQWTQQEIMSLARSFQPSCVLAAAADLNVFTLLHENPMTAHKMASDLKIDSRATAILLDALTAMQFLFKKGDIYNIPDDIAELLSEKSANNILAMVRHMSNCHRRWSQLLQVSETGKPADCGPSIRGQTADIEAFIGAMHNISEPIAAGIISKIEPVNYKCMLDIGGASGTWTIEFLKAAPDAKAILFDLPPVIPIAKQRITDVGFIDRVKLVSGDYYLDDMPEGTDLAWLGAVCHQNSRQQNRELFAKIQKAFKDGGILVIRDVVMDSSHTSPQTGALFAVNMLVATEGGGTYSFEQYEQDLRESGFTDVELVYQDEFMSSLIRAKKIV